MISNARVQEVKLEYRRHPNEVEWTIDTRTIVQEVNESYGDVLDSAYTFTPFDQLQLHADRPVDISMLSIFSPQAFLFRLLHSQFYLL